MNKEVIAKFKSLFEAERSKIVYAQSFANEEFHLQKDDVADETDLTSSELETSMRMRLRNRELLFLKKIDEALRRISDGTFGGCKQCGDEIELKRLEARPTATYCVYCKEEQERLEQVHIDGHRNKSLGSLQLA